jgi:hypothetical protein
VPPVLVPYSRQFVRDAAVEIVAVVGTTVVETIGVGTEDGIDVVYTIGVGRWWNVGRNTVGTGRVVGIDDAIAMDLRR